MGEQSSERTKKNLFNRLKLVKRPIMVDTNNHKHRGETMSPLTRQHQSQPASQKASSSNIITLPVGCHIKSVNGELMREITIHKHHTGQYLLSKIKEALNLFDTKCFGLKIAAHIDDQEDLVKSRWLDLTISVYKQIKEIRKHINIWHEDAISQTRNLVLYLRIKFYPPNPDRINDSFLQNYLWLQLRRDLRVGKLTSSYNNMAILAACIIQFKFGDYDATVDPADYYSHMRILPNQQSIENVIIQLHQTKMVGLTPQQAQLYFLRVAASLETYGFDYYPVRDHQRQRGMLLGFNYAGVKTIRNERILHHFRWHNIRKITYERRMIILHTSTDSKKQIIGFKCPTLSDCQNLYRRLLEQRYFFTVDLVSFDSSLRRSCLRQSTPSPEYRRASLLNYQDYQRTDYQCQESRVPASYRDSGQFDASRIMSNGGQNRARLTATTSYQDFQSSQRRFEAKLERQHSVFFAESSDSTNNPGYPNSDEDIRDQRLHSSCSYHRYPVPDNHHHYENRPYGSRTMSPVSDFASSVSSSMSRNDFLFSQLFQLSDEDNDDDDDDPAFINCFMSDSSSTSSLATFTAELTRVSSNQASPLVTLDPNTSKNIQKNDRSPLAFMVVCVHLLGLLIGEMGHRWIHFWRIVTNICHIDLHGITSHLLELPRIVRGTLVGWVPSTGLLPRIGEIRLSRWLTLGSNRDGANVGGGLIVNIMKFIVLLMLFQTVSRITRPIFHYLMEMLLYITLTLIIIVVIRFRSLIQ